MEANSSVLITIPMYNGIKYIKQTIQSILDQDYSDWQLAVLDDNSNDGSAEYVKSLEDSRVEYRLNPGDFGAMKNFQRCGALAQTSSNTYWKLVCQDDLLERNCLSAQVKILEQHPDVAMTSSRRKIIDSNGDVLISSRGLEDKMLGKILGMSAILSSLRSGTNLFGEPMSALLRTSVLKQVENYTDNTNYVVDMDIFLKILAVDGACFYGQSEVLCSFRVHPASWSSNIKQYKDFWTLLEAFNQKYPGMMSKFDICTGKARAVVSEQLRNLIYFCLKFDLGKAAISKFLDRRF